jgi:NAD(P)-dependent dehydrogenase (short-subunit alcohol dehydrogenase family)
MSQQRVILISGANQGIGLAAVKMLSARHPEDTILLGTRQVKNGEDAIKQSITETNNMSNVKIVQLDVTDQASVDAAVKHIEHEYGHVDVLINNSGIASVDERDVSEGVMQVNVLGVQRMNDAFLPLLLKSVNKDVKPLIIIVSSEVGTWFPYSATDAQLKQLIVSPEQWTQDTAKILVDDYLDSMDASHATKYSWKTDPAMMFMTYSVSKTLASAYSRYYAHAHPEVRVAVVCPGFTATNLNSYRGTRPVEMGGESIIWPITHDFTNGHFYRDGEKMEYVQVPKQH